MLGLLRCSSPKILDRNELHFEISHLPFVGSLHMGGDYDISPNGVSLAKCFQAMDIKGFRVPHALDRIDPASRLWNDKVHLTP